MSSIICKIQALSSTMPAKAVKLSTSLMKEWGCHPGQSIKIRVGNRTLITRILGINRNEYAIYFPKYIARQLAIPYFSEIRTSLQNRELRIGPVLAILTTGYTGSSTTPFGNRSSLFKSFLLAAQTDRPFFYVFTPEMVDWNTQTVNGWFYGKGKNGVCQWFRRTAPLPEVIYERIPNRKAESLPQVKACRERIQSITRCQIFNQGFFNKWSVHEKLYQHPLTSENIPETYPSPTIPLIKKMVDRHQMIYLKPDGGSLGMGIFRITRHPQGGYYCRFRDGEKNVLRLFHSMEKLVWHIFGQQMHRLNRYLVQQGIRLAKYDGRPVDFRVHMHKDRSEEWQVVGIGAKVAGVGCVTTHGRTGGSMISTSELLQKKFPGAESEIENKIRDASIRIARTLEEEVNGPLGELGLDIGIDRYQHVWLFEVNSKPGRHIFLHPTLRDAGKQSARYITEYSLKLANFV
ncbi:hypothetical protein GCM10011571_18600 [Marinithermofilum abyssi]|uniref:YheC/D like ATP-grasp n=1 Tax=Marinithermofilum abyssi TaxID=1571185 RepID=A0A8J2YAN7_9BACL|nr:YheC/YheD family protein [Marinithermofilum abyssi]GGE17193.1 hypothetical protein GCM10011571_18600 [Marinithermofilum abyssi]